jgi:hypothetical protein
LGIFGSPLCGPPVGQFRILPETHAHLEAD